jgi:hypothetical protein
MNYALPDTMQVCRCQLKEAGRKCGATERIETSAVRISCWKEKNHLTRTSGCSPRTKMNPKWRLKVRMTRGWVRLGRSRRCSSSSCHQSSSRGYPLLGSPDASPEPRRSVPQQCCWQSSHCLCGWSVAAPIRGTGCGNDRRIAASHPPDEIKHVR